MNKPKKTQALKMLEIACKEFPGLAITEIISWALDNSPDIVEDEIFYHKISDFLTKLRTK